MFVWYFTFQLVRNSLPFFLFLRKGQPFDVCNYRHINLLPLLGKYYRFWSTQVSHLAGSSFWQTISLSLVWCVNGYCRVCQPLDKTGEARANALNISNAFDRDWHVGLVHKLKAYFISGRIFNLIRFFKNLIVKWM